METRDYGIVFFGGEYRYFAGYRMIEEPQSTHMEVDLPSGETVKIYRYFSKRRNKYIEAIEAIYRYPNKEGEKE